MAETKPKTKKTKSPLVGHQAVPTTLNNTTQLDIDTSKIFVDSIIDLGLSGGLDPTSLENFTSLANNRDQFYQLIDTMARDSAVNAIIKTYADSACEANDAGHIVWCESKDPKVSKFINYLLDVLNVDKNIYSWTYCLVKYGDTYLRLFRESDYADELFHGKNIEKAYSAKNVLNEEFKDELKETVNLNLHRASDPYAYYVEMVSDPGTMFELTKFGKTYGYIETPNTDLNVGITSGTLDGVSGIPFANYRMKSTDVNVYQADDFVHACLDGDYSRFPEKVDIFTNEQDYNSRTNASSYTVKRGKSLLIDNYKVWREKSLLENAILLNRITKSSIVRKISVEVGDMPKEQVSQTLRRVKDLFEQKTAINNGTSMSEYNNPGPIENNIYFATHNGQGQITVDAVGGDADIKNLADLDSWVNKFYAGFGVPKAYYGWTDDGAGFNGGESLSIISAVFAKGVKHIQNAMVQAISDLINLILINKGLKAYLNNFVIKMKAPLTSDELKYRENLASRISAISNMQSLFSDIEDKPRRLKILKELISTLNYGDDILFQIDEEIKATEQQQKEEAEAAAKEAAETEENTSSVSESETPKDLDLGLSSIASVESLNKPTESKPILEATELEALANDNLPTPEELNDKIDFTENK